MAAGYTVTSVNQMQEVGGAGRLVDVVEVLFELDGDAGSGSIKVPLQEGWESAAAAAVAEKAEAMQRLLSL